MKHGLLAFGLLLSSCVSTPRSTDPTHESLEANLTSGDEFEGAHFAVTTLEGVEVSVQLRSQCWDDVFEGERYEDECIAGGWPMLMRIEWPSSDERSQELPLDLETLMELSASDDVSLLEIRTRSLTPEGPHVLEVRYDFWDQGGESGQGFSWFVPNAQASWLMIYRDLDTLQGSEDVGWVVTCTYEMVVDRETIWPRVRRLCDQDGEPWQETYDFDGARYEWVGD